MRRLEIGLQPDTRANEHARTGTDKLAPANPARDGARQFRG